MSTGTTERKPQAASGKGGDTTAKRTASKSLNAAKRADLSTANRMALSIVTTARRTLQAAEKVLTDGNDPTPEFMSAVGSVVMHGGAWLSL